MEQYPSKYKNVSKKAFKSLNLQNVACIIFESTDNEGEFESIETNSETLKKYAENAADLIFIRAKDIGLNWNLSEPPTMDSLKKINEFLHKNSNKKIYSVCDAGVARSGFVSFLLDIKNNRLDGVKATHLASDNIEDTEFYRPQSYFTNKNKDSSLNRYFSNPGFTDLLLKSDILTNKELEKLNTLYEKTN